MTDHEASLALKARLARTWPAFFERHGNFTPVQQAAIPHVLDGRNVVISAPTAHGKTEAAVAPFVESLCFPRQAGLIILYVTPTRALANDLLSRLNPALDAIGVSSAIKTRDQNTFNPQRPANILISTPESVDSLLTSQAGLFARLRAVVLDELHLLDSTPRGDQLRILLSRIRRIRDYADTLSQTQATGSVQYVALSATLPDPEAAAARYFPVDQVIQMSGQQRALHAELIFLSPDAADSLTDYLFTFRAKGWRKALIFCNSRAEVEMIAAAIRRRSPFGNAVYAHYSNIAPQRRREIEQQFDRAEVAICCATSTLELGIDIGNIDVVLLVGPPGSAQSFFQRIGRGNRRHNLMRVACFYRTPLEKLVFEALCVPALPAEPDLPVPPFRPSVAIQQIFSLLKQSPTGAVRLSELAEVFDGIMIRADLEAILGELQLRRYLKPGRPGEWKPGLELNQLYDQQASQTCELSIYSNIQNSDRKQIEVRDQHTRQAVARVDVQWLHQPVLTLEGRPINVEWVDGEAVWVTTTQAENRTTKLPYRSIQKHLSYELAQRLPLQLGLLPGAAPLLAAPEGGAWWFHWLGDLYGRVLLDLLGYRFHVTATPQSGLCLRLEDVETFIVPEWTAAQVTRYLEDHYRRLERVLDLGPFYHLLPPSLQRRTVVEQFDVRRFLEAVGSLRPLRDANPLSGPLRDLLTGYG